LTFKSERNNTIKLPNTIDVNNLEFTDANTDNEVLKTHKNTLMAAHNQKISSIKKKQSADNMEDIIDLDLSKDIAKRPRTLSKKYKATLVPKKAS